MVWVCLAALASAASRVPAEVKPSAMIGFRHDGTGIFPEDCRPPTEFDGVAGKNVAWKVPLPNFSNGSPIVVGRKVFVVCEAGWPEGADCAALLCFDAASGKELWRRDLDEFATMPPDRAKEARQVRKEYYRRIRTLNRLLYEYQSAGEARRRAILQEAAGLGAAKEESFERHSWGTGSAEQGVYTNREFSRRLRGVCAYSPITWSPTCLGITMPTPVSDGRRVFVYTGRRTVHAFDLEGNCLWQVWQSDAPYNYHWVTDCANSPLLADGLLLMYCFDHLWAYETDTGKLRYAAESLAPFRHAMGSPVLLRLPVKGSDRTEAALFLWTGDLVRVRDGRVLLKRLAPTHCASLGGDGADRLFLGVHAGTSAEAAGKSEPAAWLFQSEGQGGALGVRMVLAGDAARHEKLWFTEKNDGYKELGPYPIYRDGRLWIDSGHVVDAGTGRAVGAVKRRMDFAYNGFLLAGGHIYGIKKSEINRGSGGASGLGVRADHALNCTVAKPGADAIETVRLCPVEFFPATITDPSKKEQVVAMTGKDRYQDWYGWHEAYSAPFAAGNRLFIRTFDFLYCFGNKDEPFTPSKAFGGRG
jgi:hypothetical protein